MSIRNFRLGGYDAAADFLTQMISNSRSGCGPRILHCGLHKTGSTFLQKNFFPRATGIVYLGNYTLNAGPVAADRGKILLFSNEASCGYPYPIAENFSLSRILTNINVLNISNVILMHREFYSWVLSLYFQTLNEYRFWSLEEFIKINGAALNTWRSAPAEIAALCDRIGIELLSIDYADLNADTQRVCDRMCAFMDCDSVSISSEAHNASFHSLSAINAYRLANRVGSPRVVQGVLRVLGISPRTVFQKRGLGAALDSVSPRKLAPSDVEALLG